MSTPAPAPSPTEGEWDGRSPYTPQECMGQCGACSGPAAPGGAEEVERLREAMKRILQRSAPDVPGLAPRIEDELRYDLQHVHEAARAALGRREG